VHNQCTFTRFYGWNFGGLCYKFNGKFIVYLCLCLCVFAYSTHFLNLNAPFDGLFSDRRGFERFFHFNLCHNDNFVFVFVFFFLRLLWNYFFMDEFFLCNVTKFPLPDFLLSSFFSLITTFLSSSYLAKSYFFFFCITLLYIYIFFLCNIINYY